MNILVSSCLLGMDCRYCGTGCENSQVIELGRKYHLIPACPEQMGGMPTPRSPVELVGGKAVDGTGKNFTVLFEKGADEAVKLAKLFECTCAILKSRSPSCGCGSIYDGTFSENLAQGSGITAEKLQKAGIKVFTENNLEKLKESY